MLDRDTAREQTLSKQEFAAKHTHTNTHACTATFLQRVSIACYAERCISHDRFCLTV